MQYNTQREKLIISEYGRNIQNMIKYACAIEDDAERNATAKAIVEVMATFNPQFKSIDEFQHKLYDHLIIMSDYKLKIDSPYPYPEKPKENVQEQPLPYPKRKIRAKEYGKNLELLIEKCKNIEDPEKRKSAIDVIGYYMKLAYMNWNRENINDDAIKHDITHLSDGKLVPEAETTFESNTFRQPGLFVPEKRSPVHTNRNNRNNRNKRNNNNRNWGNTGRKNNY